MGAADDVAAAVEVALLVLAEAVDVLVRRCGEGGANLKEVVVLRPAIVEDLGVAVLVVGHGHLPAVEVEERLAVGGAEVEADAGGGPVEEPRDVGLRTGGLVRFALGREGRGDPIGGEGVSGCGGRGAPAGGAGLREDAVTGRGDGVFLAEREGDAEDVGRVGLEHDGSVAAREDDRRLWPREHSGLGEQEGQQQARKGADGGEGELAQWRHRIGSRYGPSLRQHGASPVIANQLVFENGRNKGPSCSR